MRSMDDLHRLEARGLARAKARSQRRRVSIIRRRTIRATLGLFAIFWVLIFAQLATGNDPVLSHTGAENQRATASRQGPGRTPETTAAAAAPPEREAEAERELEAEREAERELEAEREAEWGSELEWEAEPEWEPEAVEPVAPVITSSS